MENNNINTKQSKHFISTLFLILVFVLIPSTTFAKPVKVLVNDNFLDLNINPLVEQGRTLVPLRSIFEALDADVEWNQATKTITAKKDDTTIKLQINNKTATKNGKNIKLDVAPKVIRGTTVVPTRFIGESLGANVDWDQKTKTVLINSQKGHLSTTYPYYLTDGDIDDARLLVSKKNRNAIIDSLSKDYELKTHNIPGTNKPVSTIFLTPYANMVNDYSALGINPTINKNILDFKNNNNNAKMLYFTTSILSNNRNDFTNLKNDFKATVKQGSNYRVDAINIKTTLNPIGQGYYSGVVVYAVPSTDGINYFTPVNLVVSHPKSMGNRYLQYNINLLNYR